MPNLRSSPAADISREFQTGLPPDIRTRPYISFEYIKADSTDTVLAGESEGIDILAPSGYVYEIVNGRLFARPPSGASSGDHEIAVIALGVFTVSYAKSNYNKNVSFFASEWDIADISSHPASNQLKAIQSCLTDEDSPIRIVYNNRTDADQTNRREIRFLIRKVKV